MKANGESTLRALDRFGFGARPGDPGRIDDPRGWLEAQLDGPAPSIGAGGLARRPEIAELQSRFRSLRQDRDPQSLQQVRRRQNAMAEAEVRASLGERVSTPRPFAERLVAFWSNHLCISIASKPQRLALLAGLYEREAIRPHVFGRFDDMVLASARHPAMLIYLDNAQSIGPNSAAARQSLRRNVSRGLNENYARELLELHTLGVDGGYVQDDVVGLARILTGWSVGAANAGARPTAPADGLDFVFRPATHEPGPKTVLGVRYEDDGVREGEAVIRDLCRHGSTARFVATKLVAHFVSDEPPPGAVAVVERVFRDTEGDLREVSRSLAGLDAAWDPANRKFRTPQDWVVAAMRALGAAPLRSALPNVLGQLRHPMWSPPSPKGYPDTRAEWADADALMNRAELARTLGGRVPAGGARPGALLELIDLAVDSPLPGLLADETIDVSERFALALGGPAFQWR